MKLPSKSKTNVALVFLLTLLWTSMLCASTYNGHRWPSNGMPTFYVNQNGTPDCSGEFTAIQSALQTWNNVTTTYANFQYGGTTSNTSARTLDNTNLMMWVETGWLTLFPGQTNAVAIATTWYVGDTNVETDISFNGDLFTWSDNGEVGKFDVQNLATHELGHTISLADLYGGGDSEKTMYGYSVSGETKKRTLELDDEDGIRYVYFSPTVSGTLAEDQRWVPSLGGTTVNLTNNLTIPTGRSLMVASGMAVSPNGYYKLTVNGNFSANGATFQGSGTRGSWYGIEINSTAFSMINGLTIKDADYGLIVNNNSAYLASNSFRNSSYAVYLTNYSDATFFQNGFTSSYWIHIYGDNTCAPDIGSAPGAGYNALRSGSSQVVSNYSGTIYAMYNWWGSYPASPSVSGNVDYSNALSSDPVPSLKIVSAENNSTTLYNNATSASPSFKNAESSASDDLKELNAAHKLFINAKYTEAFPAFEAIISKYPSSFAAKRSIVFIERCLEKLGRSSEVLSQLNEITARNNNLPINPFLELRKASVLVKSERYGEAMQLLSSAINKTTDSTDLKFALYTAGSTAYYDLNDKTTAKQYYGRLIELFPEDVLSKSALVTLADKSSQNLATKKPSSSNSNKLDDGILHLQNYPNPFNPTTVIHFTLPQSGVVSLKVFDMLGREVTTLLNEYRTAGAHQVNFNASSLTSGVYFYKLEAGGKSMLQKMLLVK